MLDLLQELQNRQRGAEIASFSTYDDRHHGQAMLTCVHWFSW